jgi:hypothetical protein
MGHVRKSITNTALLFPVTLANNRTRFHVAWAHFAPRIPIPYRTPSADTEKWSGDGSQTSPKDKNRMRRLPEKAR